MGTNGASVMRAVAAARAAFACLFLFIGLAGAHADALKDCNSTDLDKRIAGCTKALKTLKFDKKNLSLLYTQRGQAYVDKQDYDRALEDLNECVELDPKSVACWVNKALVHSEKGQVDEKIEAYRIVLGIMDKKPKPTDDELAMLVLMDAEVSRTLTDRADGNYNKVVQALGGSNAPGAALDDANRQALESAVADVSKCLDILPGHSICQAKRALYLKMLGRRDEAIADATKARTADTKNADAVGVLAGAAFEDKDLAKAVTLAKEWQTLAPGDTKATELVMQALEASGQKEEAAAFRATAGQQSCNDAVAALQDGKELNLDAGIAACTLAAGAPGIDNATLVTYLEYRAALHGRKGNFADAVADYTRCLELAGGEGENVMFYQQRGINLVNLGQYERAIADLDEALKKKPGDVNILEFRGYAHVQLGAADKAKADFTQIIGIDPKQANAYAGLGDIERNAQNFDAAAKHYGKVIEFNPSSVSAYYLRGLAYENLGRKDEAIADYRKALSLDPGLAEPGEALKRLGASP